MSNQDKLPLVTRLEPGQPCTAIEVLEPRLVPLGGPRAMTVYRTLPQRKRSLVGAWCFLDHYGPDDVSKTGGMVVPRHPHTGLATVSWIFTGIIEHVDSSGVLAQVRPGELNLMIAGSGISHQEISPPETLTLHGVQLWYALPNATRFAENRFEHYIPDPLVYEGMTVRVFIGSLLGSKSPVQTLAPDLLGAELVLEPGTTITLKLRTEFEHAVLAETGDIQVNGRSILHRSLAYIPLGCDTLELKAGEDGARLILLGGEPLGEPILMWWNFVGRSHEEITEYRRRYQAEMGFAPADPQDVGKPKLFGSFPPNQRAPIPPPELPKTRLVTR